eukprot:gene57906-biopygen25455
MCASCDFACPAPPCSALLCSALFWNSVRSWNAKGSERCEAPTSPTQAPSKSPTPWTLQGAGKGCSNWEDIDLSQTAESSASACGERCQSTGGCIRFGYQHSTGASDTGEACDGVVVGRCLTYSGACTQTDNWCWDLYELHATTAPSNSPTEVYTDLGQGDCHDDTMHD